MVVEAPTPIASPARERGVALVATLLLTLLLAALAAALATMSIAESRVMANFREGRETLYLAGAGVERVLETLALAPGWTEVLRGVSPSGLIDVSKSAGAPAALGDLEALTTELQRQSDARFDRGPDNPQWLLYAFGSAAGILSTAASGSDRYLAIWVADDAGESDGDPRTDTNGLLLVRSEAFGPAGARRSVEALVERHVASNLHQADGDGAGADAGATAGPIVRLRSWRETR
jgi:hypothetical protein